MLSEISTVEKVWGLPSPAPHYSVLTPIIIKPGLFREVETCPVTRAVLRDRWGRQILSFPLQEYFTLRTSEAQLVPGDKEESLDSQLSLIRTRNGEEGVICSLSDGSEIVCDGVLYCDGPSSQGRKMLVHSGAAPSDPSAVTCWSFVRRDLLRPNAWEFRTALGKSVEQLPLPDAMVRIKLRFRTTYGAHQTAAELRELFSEFGPDMEALLEGVEPEEISFVEERSPSQLAFSPTPGTLALGEAALGVPLLGTFDWSGRMVRRQMERVIESVLTENWDPTAFEPHCHDVSKPILKAERYFRGALHYDNVFLRPLRDLALRFTPESVLRDRVKSRLIF